MAKKLNQITAMPQMKAAFAGWTYAISLQVVTQEVRDNGFVDNTESSINFKGVIQPLQPNKIMLKPEGQRSFEWLQIHCLDRNVDLSTNDRIIYNDRKFKVMAKNDYGLNNYIEYHAIEDYENGGDNTC